MTTWSVVDNESGREVFVEARLWYEARATGVIRLAELGCDVGQDGVHVTEMPAGWARPPETSTGALMGSKEARP